MTTLETILTIYITVVNVLGVIALIMAKYASKKVGETIVIILLGVAIPITLPMVLYEKRKQDLEQQFDDLVKEKENE